MISFIFFLLSYSLSEVKNTKNERDIFICFQGCNSICTKKNLVTLQQSDQHVSSKRPICLFKENDDKSRELCEKENLIPYKVSASSHQNSFYLKISDLTKHSSDVSIYILSDSEITLNLDNLESAKIQSINCDKSSTITIDNKNSQESVKTLILKDIKVLFADKNLKYGHLTLDRGAKIEDLQHISFNNVKKMNVDASILKEIPKTLMKTNSVVFERVVKSITFIENGFIFQLVHDNEFEIDFEDYNEIEYPFIFNESNITLIKECSKPCHFVLPIQYDNYNNNNYFLIVDSSFGDDNSELDITIDAEKVRLLTYSTVIPFKFSQKVEQIQIGLGQYENVRAVNFVTGFEVSKESTLTFSTISNETDYLLNEKSIKININEVELKDKSTLISDCDSFLFTNIVVDDDASVSLVGVTGNGKLDAEGIDNQIDIVSNPTKGHASNFANSIFTFNIENDLYTVINAHNSPKSSPLFKFDHESIQNSVKGINVKFEKFDRSLDEFSRSVKVIDLIQIEQPYESSKCQEIAEKISFIPDVFTTKDGKESIEFAPFCNDNNVAVLGQIHSASHVTTIESTTKEPSSPITPTQVPSIPITPTLPVTKNPSTPITTTHIPTNPITQTTNPSTPTSVPTTLPTTLPSQPSDGSSTGGNKDDDKDTGINHRSKKKRNRIIAIACACGSAVIIVAVAVSVALYLRKHHREGDSERAQMMAHLDPNNEVNVII